MSIWVVDVESNGLLDVADTIWAIAGKKLDEDEWVLYSHSDWGSSIEGVLDFLDRKDALCFHNGIKFDRPLIHKLTDRWLQPKIIDTLVMSKVLYPDRPGGHSVKNLAKYFHLNEEKVEQEQWEEFEDNMIERVESDVRMQEQIYRHLLEEAK